MDQLLSEFLREAEDLIDGLADDVRVLRGCLKDGWRRRELVAQIFRNAHTLKGASSSLEQTAIAEFTHEFESLLDSVRSGRLNLNASLLDVFEDSIASISEMLNAVAVGRRPLAPIALVDSIRELAQGAGNAHSPSPAIARAMSELPQEITSALSTNETHRVSEAISEGAGAYLIEVNFELATFDKQFRGLSATLKSFGEIISTQPDAGLSHSDQIAFRIVFATEKSAQEMAMTLERFVPLTIKELVGPSAKEVKNSVGSEDLDGGGDAAGASSLGRETTYVRVELSELKQVADTTRDLFRETMDVLDKAVPLQTLTDEDPSELRKRADQIREIFEDLEYRLSQLRTIPLARTLSRAVRAGAAAARSMGKDVDFQIEGGEIRIDGPLSDSMADPLLHLLRNAVDHGIESSTERQAKGKNTRGFVRIEARVHLDQLRLRVVDDGRGIDPEHVYRVARERGMLQNNNVISQQESFRIIFAPGFSTVASVTSTSGRGVGLDVVSRSVEKIGGKVLVHSEIGVGSMFELVLPLAGFTPPVK